MVALDHAEAQKVSVLVAKRSLRPILPILWILTLVHAVVLLFFLQEQWTRYFPLVVVWGALITVHVLDRLNKSRQALHVLSIGILVAISTAMALNGGVRAYAYMATIPIGVLVATVYGWRTTLAYVFVMIALGGIFAWLGARGLIRELPPLPAWSLWISIALFLILASVTAYVPIRLLHQLLEEREQQLQELKRAKDAEIASAMAFEAVFDQTYQLMGLLTPDGNFIRANKSALEVMARRLDEISGKPFEACSKWEASPGANIKDSIAGAAAGQRVRFNAHHTDGQGKVRAFEFSLSPFLDSNGKIAYLILEGRDTTERDQAEAKIRRLNRLYAVSSGINEAIVRVVDTQELYETACRIAVERGGLVMAWVGLAETSQELLQPAASWGRVDSYLNFVRISTNPTEILSKGPGGEAYRTGAPAVCNDIEADNGQLTTKTEALERGYRSCATFPIKVDGRPVGIFAFYSAQAGFFNTEEIQLLNSLTENISFAVESRQQEGQRKQAELALRESEARFRQLAENIDEVFWLNDPQSGDVLYISPAYEKIWGRTCQSLYDSPKSWMDAVHPDDVEPMKRSRLHRQGRGGFVETFRILRPDNTVRWIQNRAFPLHKEDGSIYRVLGTASDITAQRSLEDQLSQAQRIDALGKVAGGVAHDFNNILTAIVGNTELALKGSSDAKVRSRLMEINKAAERAGGLTRQLLSFSRKRVIRTSALSLNAIVEDMQKMLERIIGDNYQIKTVLFSGLASIKADKGQMEQMIMNLVVNARDAMPKGGEIVVRTQNVNAGQMFASWGTIADSTNMVMLSVEDSGMGIPEEIRPHLFEPYFTTKKEGVGTGLGLSTVYGIVRQNGGAIGLDSFPEKGSIFRVYLPATSEAPTPVSHSVPTLDRSPGDETILVAEDNQDLAEVVNEVLGGQGYKVLTAGNGEVALRMAREHKGALNLLLSDVIMPGKSSEELVHELRTLHPHIKLMFMSGYVADALTQKTVEQFGAAFLEKPFTPDQLVEKVRAVLLSQ